MKLIQSPTDQLARIADISSGSSNREFFSFCCFYRFLQEAQREEKHQERAEKKAKKAREKAYEYTVVGEGTSRRKEPKAETVIEVDYREVKTSSVPAQTRQLGQRYIAGLLEEPKD
jgi:hypothetical protein